MTRLLFMEQNKVDSLKAKSDKAVVSIVVDNPRILPEQSAKSLPALPSPPAAPESPVAVEGWKGAKVGGWIRINKSKKNNKKQVHPPAASSDQTDTTTTTTTTADALGKLTVADEDDQTEYTEESSSVTTTTALDTATPVDRPTQLFPSNAARASSIVKKTAPGNQARKLGQAATTIKGFPLLKKRSSKPSGSSLSAGNGSSPSSSGAED